MAKVHSLSAGGRTILPAAAPGSEDAWLAAEFMNSFLTERGVRVVAEKSGLLMKRKAFVEFPFQGTAIEKVDSERSVKGGVLGAVAGGLLLGPIGLIGGGFLGAKKSHFYTLARGNDVALLELSSSEERSLLGRGFGTNASSFPEGKPAKRKGKEVERYCVSCQSMVPAFVPRQLYVLEGFMAVFVFFLCVLIWNGWGILLGAAVGWGVFRLGKWLKRDAHNLAEGRCSRCSSSC